MSVIFRLNSVAAVFIQELRVHQSGKYNFSYQTYLNDLYMHMHMYSVHLYIIWILLRISTVDEYLMSADEKRIYLFKHTIYVYFMSYLIENTFLFLSIKHILI